MPVVQRSVVLDEADRGVLEGLDVSGLSKAITGLAAQQLKDALAAVKKLNGAATATSTDVTAAQNAIGVVDFWIEAVPAGHLDDVLAPHQAVLAAARTLTSQLEKMLTQTQV